MRRSYGLPVRDQEGRAWDFVVKSWANGTEHRRVYVLEHALEFINARRLREGDAIGICADAQGALVVEVPCLTQTPDVPQAPCATCGRVMETASCRVSMRWPPLGSMPAHDQAALTMCCTSLSDSDAP